MGQELNTRTIKSYIYKIRELPVNLIICMKLEAVQELFTQNEILLWHY
jgi:hypothetical protein